MNETLRMKVSDAQRVKATFKGMRQTQPAQQEDEYLEKAAKRPLC